MKRSSLQTLRLLAPGAVLVLLAFTAPLAQDGKPPHPGTTAPTLANLAWMAGAWRGSETGGTVDTVSEEVWSAPEGDSMMGMFRIVADGKVRLFELIALLQDDKGIAMRIRHFDPKFVAREDKDAPVVLPLTRGGTADSAEAMFEGTTPRGFRRLTYTKTGADELKVLLERGDEKDEFFFKRAGRSAK